jgi:hypothetical protein
VLLVPKVQRARIVAAPRLEEHVDQLEDGTPVGRSDKTRG